MFLRNIFEDMQRTGQGKTAVVGWGRGMGHKGHMMLASSVITQAGKVGGDPYFVVSKTVGKDDPITPDEKIAIYKKVFPQSGHIFQPATDEIPDLTRVLANLNQQGYTNVTVVLGADQVKAFQYLKNYNNKPDKSGNILYSFDSLDVISRQETGDPSAGEEGPRATPMRQVLMDPSKSEQEQFAVWRDAMSPEIGDDEVRALMAKAKERMTAMSAPKPKKAKVAEQESPAMAHTAKSLENPPKVMQHRARRDQERDKQWMGTQIAKNDRTSKDEWGDFKEGEQDPQSELKMINQKLKDAYKQVRNNSSVSIGWYMSEVKELKARREELIKQLRQGVAEGLNEFAPDSFNGGGDGDAFSPAIAKMAQEDGFTKGAGLADGATLERAITINHWHSQHGGMYKQYFAKGFKAGRMNKINHDNKQYNLNLKLMKDGSIRHGEQGVAEGVICPHCEADPCICDDSHGFVREERMSAAVRMQRAADRQRAKSDASLRRTPSSIPKAEPKKDEKVAEKMLPKSAFAGSNKNKLGPAGQWKNTGPSKNRAARAGDLVGGDAQESVDKKKGADGKACWKGYKYAGTENGKDKCVPMSENVENIMDSLINKIVVNEAMNKSR